MTPSQAGRADQPPWYEIRLKGHLEHRWASWFDGLDLTTEPDGTTALRGPVVDQAALHGLLYRVRDAGLPLISVTRIDAPEPAVPSPTAVDPPPAVT
jgi:hypothetical protein